LLYFIQEDNLVWVYLPLVFLLWCFHSAKCFRRHWCMISIG